LEAELKRLGATFSVTAALEVTSHAPRIMKRLAPAVTAALEVTSHAPRIMKRLAPARSEAR
jgi:hypothetical protein